MSAEKSIRERQLESALLTALLRIEENPDPGDQTWARLIREHFGFPPKEKVK